MKSINARDLRNDYARVLRDVEGGENYTVTNRGHPVAQIGPLLPQRPGPQEGVPFGAVAGNLAHLGASGAAQLREQLTTLSAHHGVDTREDGRTLGFDDPWLNRVEVAVKVE